MSKGDAVNFTGTRSMNLKDIAKSTLELSNLLCISVPETWEKHTDASIKSTFRLNRLKLRFQKSKKAIDSKGLSSICAFNRQPLQNVLGLEESYAIHL